MKKPSGKIMAIYDKYEVKERENNEMARMQHMISSIMHYLDE